MLLRKLLTSDLKSGMIVKLNTGSEYEYFSIITNNIEEDKIFIIDKKGDLICLYNLDLIEKLYKPIYPINSINDMIEVDIENLELIWEKFVSLSQLKSGMLVILENTRTYKVLLNSSYGDILVNEVNGTINIDDYDDDFKHKLDRTKSINFIYQVTREDLKSIPIIFHDEYCIWMRTN